MRQIVLNVSRLEFQKASSAAATGWGTAFWVGGWNGPVLVTNKHVAENLYGAILHGRLSAGIGDSGGPNKPVSRYRLEVEHFKFHKDADLAVLCSPVITPLDDSDREAAPYPVSVSETNALDVNHILTREKLIETCGLLMQAYQFVGFPSTNPDVFSGMLGSATEPEARDDAEIGKRKRSELASLPLWDTKNELPITPRLNLASHIALDYQNQALSLTGRDIVLVEALSTNGASGSPVMCGEFLIGVIAGHVSPVLRDSTGVSRKDTDGRVIRGAHTGFSYMVRSTALLELLAENQQWSRCPCGAEAKHLGGGRIECSLPVHAHSSSDGGATWLVPGRTEPLPGRYITTVDQRYWH